MKGLMGQPRNVGTQPNHRFVTKKALPKERKKYSPCGRPFLPGRAWGHLPRGPRRPPPKLSEAAAASADARALDLLDPSPAGAPWPAPAPPPRPRAVTGRSCRRAGCGEGRAEEGARSPAPGGWEGATF